MTNIAIKKSPCLTGKPSITGPLSMMGCILPIDFHICQRGRYTTNLRVDHTLMCWSLADRRKDASSGRRFTTTFGLPKWWSVPKYILFNLKDSFVSLNRLFLFGGLSANQTKYHPPNAEFDPENLKFRGYWSSNPQVQPFYPLLSPSYPIYPLVN